MTRKLAAAFGLAVALIALETSPALAQGVGIKSGWLFSDLTAEAIDFDQRTGWQVGAFFGGNRSGLLGLMAEVNYGEKGATADLGEQGEKDYDIRFVSVPTLLRLNVGSRSLSGVSFYGIVGPQFDWLISQKIGDVDITNDTEGFEVSLAAGGGIEITRFIIELRYVRGLKSIAKNLIDLDLLDESSDLKSNAFAILFGFRFN